ncbi:hypothetical protein L208DRAFT_1269320, partial [Tricholoma matsutake]
LNANGLADPMKINAINSMVKSVKPHLMVIQETKSVQNVAAQLHLPGYDFHKSLGCPIHNQRLSKWGVLVAVHRFVFNVQRVSTPPPLDGQVVALDLTIPLTTGQAFTHRFIGI